jgi:hypothetical protein
VQSTKDCESPMQGSPPLKGVGLSQVRVRLFLPLPHDAEHSDHSDHDDHSPFTATQSSTKDAINGWMDGWMYV